MEIAHINQRQLAARWNISEAALERFPMKKAVHRMAVNGLG